MSKIIIPLNAPESECEAGLTNYCSWKRLEPYLKQASGLSEGEYIKGIQADKDGLLVFIGTKSKTK